VSASINIAIIDYGAGNVASVERALHLLGASPARVSIPDAIASAGALVLPGVGHFSTLLRALDERALRAPLLEAISRGIPFLGICLGLQALFDASEESPEFAGLHLFPGKVARLPDTVKLPHMGWNQVARKRDSRLLAGVPPGAYFYFAHSFAASFVQGASASNSAGVACCSHGAEFIAVLERDNIFGVQFHPEKSGEPGAQLLRNFLRLAS
jgi:imidazole glycerol-phosphate synthase subunit HisH